MIVPEWLRQRARATPARLALVAPGVRWSFRELNARVDSAAGQLSALGVRRGERVALLLRNGAPFVVLVHAGQRLGLELVPLNTRLTVPELRYQVADAAVRLAVHDEGSARAASELDVATVAVEQVVASTLGEGGVAGDGRVDLRATHTIVYTSGTTGQPKGAVLTNGNHWWSAVASALNLGVREEDRWLACLPLFHVGGLAIVLRGAIYGMGIVVQDGFDEAAVNSAIDEEGVTTVSVVTAMLQRMLAERGERPYPASLRCVLLGGGPAPLPLLEACAARGVPVVQTYGLTEAASQVATLAPEDALQKLGSAGKPLMPTDLRVDAPTGEVGEIMVRGPSISPGYLNRGPSVDKEGWLRTGDVGRLDEEGYLYVVDRREDLIISGGENVYPAEVEAALMAHPAVLEAGVHGVADERWGKVVTAAVVLRPGASPATGELIRHCRERLAGYKVPSAVRIVEQLPRNAAGKLLRRLL